LAACGGRATSDAQGGASGAVQHDGSAGPSPTGGGAGGTISETGGGGLAGATQGGAGGGGESGGRAGAGGGAASRCGTCPEGTDCLQNLAGGYQCTPCGGDKQRCCSDQRCDHDGCCIDQACWAAGGPCTAAHLGTCTAGRCTGCGVRDTPCCPGVGSSGMNSHGTCTDPRTACESPGINMCRQCGGPAQVCCEFNQCMDGGCCWADDQSMPRRCLGAGNACPSAGMCSSSSCGTCGGAGQPCCEAFNCTAPNTSCSAQPPNPLSCVPCGGPGQTCCPSSVPCKDALRCLVDKCVAN
jgi:hypothetical protein